MLIVDRIIELMKLKVITAKKFCEDFGYNRNKANDWKSGKSAPEIENISKISEYFCVSCEYLLTGTENQPPINLMGELKEEEVKIIARLRTLNPTGFSEVEKYIDIISGNDKYRADAREEGAASALARA